MKLVWLEKRLKALDKSKTALAEAVGIPPPRVTEIIKGTRQVSVPELVPMAEFLRMPVGDLILALTKKGGEIESKQPLLEVRGRVQAGVWSEAFEWQKNERYQVPMPIPKRFRDLPSFGLVVGGDSMDEIYPEGAVLLCIPIESYPDPLKTGMRVIVQRTRKNGDVEATVKEYARDGERIWLMSRSRNPAHRAPIYLDGPDTEKTEVLAVVAGYYKEE